MRRYTTAVMLLAFLLTATNIGCMGEPVLPHAEPAAVPTQDTEIVESTSTLSDDSQGETNVIATPTAEAPQGGLPASIQALFDRARKDLAQRLGVRPETIRLVSVESVQWPDTSLGCPQPDQMYAQVITPGYRVVLRASGNVYTYHADQGERLVLCEQEPRSGAPPPSSPVAPGLEGLAERAREDLAARLSIQADQIEVLEARSVVWPDGSLGCPEPDMAYTQVQVEGVLVRLGNGQRVYSYHGGEGRPLFLCERATTDQNP